MKAKVNELKSTNKELNDKLQAIEDRLRLTVPKVAEPELEPEGVKAVTEEPTDRVIEPPDSDPGASKANSDPPFRYQVEENLFAWPESVDANGSVSAPSLVPTPTLGRKSLWTWLKNYGSLRRTSSPHDDYTMDEYMPYGDTTDY
jgi:hypothetical protein